MSETKFENLRVFDSARGSVQILCCKKDEMFVLNSLEILDYTQFVYRCLKSSGFEVVVFIDLTDDPTGNISKYSYITYDRKSYCVFNYRDDYNKATTDDELYQEVKRRQEAGPKGLGVNTRSVVSQSLPPTIGMTSYGNIDKLLDILRLIRPFFGKNNNNAKIAFVLSASVIINAARSQEAQQSAIREQLEAIFGNRTSAWGKMLLISVDDFYQLKEFWSSLTRMVPSITDKYKGIEDANLADFAKKDPDVRLTEICGAGDDEIQNLLLRFKLYESNRFTYTREESGYFVEHVRRYFKNKKTGLPIIKYFYRMFTNEIETLSAELKELYGAINKQNNITIQEIQGKATLKINRLPETESSIKATLREIEEEEKGKRKPLAALDELIGLEPVKKQVRAIQAKIKNKIDRRVLLTGPGHYIFSGNPGTGKTEVAKLTGQIFQNIGALPRSDVKKVAARDLKGSHVGSTEENVRKILHEALGGVLFIEEAYELVNTGQDETAGHPDPFAAAAYTAIMDFMDENRSNVCVICAGYKEHMQKFVAANPGTESRFAESIDFPDYSEDELFKILEKFAQSENFKLELSNGYKEVARNAIKLLLRRKGPGFGNARTIRKLLEESESLMAVRVDEIKGARSGLLVAEDIPEMYRHEIDHSKLEDALGRLDNLIGLVPVKESVKTSLNHVTFVGNDRGPGHYIFYGNPGTGKTEVARLMGDIFKAMGLLQKGQLEEVSGSDLVAGFVGQTGGQTRKKLEKALDGVLFVDEAYTLTDSEGGSNSFGKEAFDEIMKFMEDNRDRLCVIFAGYADKMEAFEKKNPGMPSRIGKDNRIKFPDYSKEELLQILSLMTETHKPPFAMDDSFIEKAKEAIHQICAEKNSNFGNARAMRELLASATRSYANRMARQKYKSQEEIPADVKNRLTDADISVREVKHTLKVAFEKLEQLIGLASVKESVKSALNRVKFVSADQGPGHYIFYGNPGTGKTEVARLMGDIFNAMGLLQKGCLVEVSRSDLVAGYVGQTGEKTRKKLEEALDGVLFVDEAYTLTDSEGGSNSFGKEAFDEIMKFMEDNRARLCVIFAGYTDKMRTFEEMNPGMKSRIGEDNRIEFPDYSEDELLQILCMMAETHKPPFTMGESFIEKAKEAIHQICAKKNSNLGNARAMRNVLASATVSYSNRMAVQYKSQEEVPADVKNRLIGTDISVR